MAKVVAISTDGGAAESGEARALEASVREALERQRAEATELVHLLLERLWTVDRERTRLAFASRPVGLYAVMQAMFPEHTPQTEPPPMLSIEELRAGLCWPRASRVSWNVLWRVGDDGGWREGLPADTTQENAQHSYHRWKAMGYRVRLVRRTLREETVWEEFGA